MLVAVVFDSLDFAAAIEPAAFKINGDTTAAELTIMNFLLVKFGDCEAISNSFFFMIF